MAKKINKAELKKRLRNDPDGEQALALERIRAVRAELDELEYIFSTISSIASSEKISENASDINDYCTCASADMGYAEEQLERLVEAEAQSLLSVLEERIGLRYDKKII